MQSNAKLLEKLVLEAVERLKTLSEDRGRLEQEVTDLRERLEVALAEVPRQDDGEPAWASERAQVVSAVRETLAELRGG